MQIPKNIVRPLGLSLLDNQCALFYASKRRLHSKLSLALSEDGVNFSESKDAPVIMTAAHQTEAIERTDNYHFATILGKKLLTYSRNDKLVLAEEQNDEWDLATWELIRSKLPRAKAGLIVPEFKHNGQYVLVYSSNDINIALSKDLKSWASPHQAIIQPRQHHFDNSKLKVLAAQNIAQGLLVIYESVNYRKRKQVLSIGAVLLSRSNPATVVWRSEGPLWQNTINRSNGLHSLGAIIYDQQIQLFLSSATGKLLSVTLPQPFAIDIIGPQADFKLDKYAANPILAPEGGGDWESVGTFNPAILQEDGKVHILYRALDYSGISYIGYANTSDGYTIDYRHPEPAYWPRADFEAGNGMVASSQRWSESYGSGGGWGGCEDPKVTLIDGRVYLTYVAHNGYGPPRLAMSSIARDDFLNHQWDKWEEPRLISEPGVVNKSGIILPEKINGRYVVFHRVFPNILIHYTDNLDKLGREEWLDSHDIIPPRPHGWDSRKLSLGSTPIRIDEGWLVIYHAVDDRDDSRYKIGAMILDHDNPGKILYRTNAPILEPDMPYENEWKFGIAYPSGAAIIDGTLFVYYGGGDRHVCVATANLEDFVSKLIKHEEAKLVAA